MSTSSSSTKEAWSSHSTAYEAQVSRMTRQSAHRLIDLTNELHPYSAEKSEVLDNGAGTGSVTIALCSRYPSIRVMATDISQKMLDILEAKKLDNVSTRRLDACVLDNGELASEMFSHALSTFMVQFTPSPETVLREMYRVLQPGGVVGIGIWGQGIDTLNIWQDACRTIDPQYVAPSTFPQGTWTTTDELEKALKDAEFTEVRSEASKLHFDFEDTEAFLRFMFESKHPTMQKFIGSWTGDLGEVRKAVEKIVRERFDDAKAIYLDIILSVAKK